MAKRKNYSGRFVKAKRKEKENKSLKIEIDQSGRVEYTSHDTVIAFSNGEKKAIKLKAKDKRELQKFFRSIGKGHSYVIRLFSFLIFLLMKDCKFSKIVIDTEYVGWDGVIRGYLLADLAKIGRTIEPGAIQFSRIGKLSEAHWHGYWVFKKKRGAEIVVSAKEILHGLID